MKKIVLTFVFSLGAFASFIILSSLLAAGIGEGKLHTFLSIILFLILPFIIAVTLSKERHHRFFVSIAIWGTFGWIISFVLFAGARHTVKRNIGRHGGWVATITGLKSRSSSDRIIKKVLEKLPSDGTSSFHYKGGSIITNVTLENGNKKIQIPMILDTGATISTISEETAQRLGVRLISSPMEVQTAGGKTSMTLGIIKKVSIGGFSVSPVAVAVCKNCHDRETGGLVGLNFTRHFHISIDTVAGKINLEKTDSWVDRKDEIEPFIETTQLKGELKNDSLEISAIVTNHADRRLRNLVFECSILDEKKRSVEKIKYTIPVLEAGKEKKVIIRSSPEFKVSSLKWELQRAFW